jgi:NAD(P)-dependent dehydrogenase (short-subunit alcohol dehydrogenase family)
MRLTDRTAIVTGAGDGIGLAIALALAGEGARVVTADIHRATAEVAAERSRAAGAHDALAFACDVSNEASVAACCDAAIDRFGGLDMIVNNAGVMTFKPLRDFTGEDWLKVLDVDLMGAVYFTRQAMLRMRKGGAIVNVSSVHAVETSPNVAPYAAAKAALLSLTRSTSIEGRAQGIRANAVLPGAVDTPMLWENPNLKAGLEKIPQGELGKPEQIAAAVVFLLSDEAAFISGATLRVDGGRLAMLAG